MLNYPPQQVKHDRGPGIAAAIVGRREGLLLPLRGFRLALLVALLLATCAVLWPGLEELASWRLLTSGG